ncbi:hypothetical protein K438DRAFT_164512 [Mycena galopus ATCC 62051]|nr:hypothetical protein K438DRAFT_164512 [Mycena galopus ATCC 62051]
MLCLVSANLSLEGAAGPMRSEGCFALEPTTGLARRTYPLAQERPDRWLHWDIPSPVTLSDATIQKYVKSSHARVVTGDASIKADTQCAWDEAGVVDALIFTVGMLLSLEPSHSSGYGGEPCLEMECWGIRITEQYCPAGNISLGVAASGGITDTWDSYTSCSLSWFLPDRKENTPSCDIQEFLQHAQTRAVDNQFYTGQTCETH